MDPDDDTSAETGLLQEQSLGEYRGLLQLMDNRHLAAFRSLVRRALAKQPPAIDIDHRLAHPVAMSLLDRAASEDLADFVEFLLEVGADPNVVNPERNRAPIHFAAEKGNAAALAALTRHPAINPNVLAGQMTALHYAVKAHCEDCLRLLLDAGASPNIPNSKGLTALHFAAERNSRSMVQIILEHSKILDLDTYRDRRKETARSLIEKKFPDLRLPTESEKPDSATLLRYYLTANDEGNFLSKLSEAKELEGPESLAELLRLSVERDLAEATDALLAREGAKEVSLLELARLAIERAHPKILDKLLARSPRMANHLLLSASQELGIPGSAGERLRCLELVLGQPEVDVRQEDDKGNSALHYAARAECREAIDRLLRKGCYVGHANAFGAPPLAHLAPAVLEEHLDRCLGSSNDRTEDYEIVMDYQNLVPHNYAACGADDSLFESRRRSSRNRASMCSETEALLYIADSKNLRHLLKHPILASFLYLKYLRIRHVLYFNSLLYLLYYGFLIVYIWLITSDAPDPEVEQGNASVAKASGQGDDGANGMAARWQNHPVLSALVLVTLMYLVIRETLQLVSGPIGYALNPENWLEAGLIGLTVALLCGAGREIGALLILASTWELVILMAQHPRLATDIVMFKTVTLNFAKFLFLYIFLIMAFAWAFYVLFKGDDNFPNPVGSLFKTVIMLTGEFDSSDLQFGVYPVISRLVFIGFIFLIVIILLNLLNGLAVNDTAEILSEAELVTLVSRARLVAYAERMVLGGPLSPSALGFGCLGPGPSGAAWLGALARAPMRFVARRILLFPRYLPHARISVKPLKSYEITLHGRARSGSRCSALTMDPTVAQRAKQVLADRDRRSSEDRIMERLETMDTRFDALEALIKQVAQSLVAPRPRTASAISDDRSEQPFFE